jgi:hypothetical protein
MLPAEGRHATGPQLFESAGSLCDLCVSAHSAVIRQARQWVNATMEPV